MPHSSRYPLRQWIWRAFVQSALIPLILVESVLIAVYLLRNQAIRDAQIGHLEEAALVCSFTVTSCRWPICVSRISCSLSRYTAFSTDSTSILGIIALCTKARHIHCRIRHLP